MRAWELCAAVSHRRCTTPRLERALPWLLARYLLRYAEHWWPSCIAGKERLVQVAGAIESVALHERRERLVELMLGIDDAWPLSP